MKRLLITLSFIFVSCSSFAYDESSFGVERDERTYVQNVVRQIRTLGKKKAQVYRVVAEGTVYMYTSPRGAVRRMNKEDMAGFDGINPNEPEQYVARKVKPDEKLRIIPLNNGIGVIRRPKQKDSYYYVVLSHFMQEDEYERMLEEKNAPQPVFLKLGKAELVLDSVAFLFRSDYERYLTLSAQADEESVSLWLKNLIMQQRAYMIRKGGDVVILRIDGDAAEVLWRGNEAWTQAAFLRNIKGK